MKLERTLRDEYFTRWDENCDVAEFRGFRTNELESLFSKIQDKFQITGKDIRPKLRGIQWAGSWTNKVYEFSFGELNGSGTVYFGVIALSRDTTTYGDRFNSITCLYKLSFAIGDVKVTERTEKYFLGIPDGSHSSTWYERKNLKFVTRDALANFCRVKALDAFHREGLTSFVQ